MKAIDGEVKKIAAELWGTDETVKERAVGKGRVFRGVKPEEVLAKLGVTRDFGSDKPVNWIHRSAAGMDVYFLAGADDFIIHVAARDTDDLRAFVVENLNADADVAGTQTSLIFEHLRGAAPL